MGLVAHRTLLRRIGRTGRADATADFERKCGPSLAHARRIGGSYGASTFLALMALIDNDMSLAAGDRVGVFSYGSGSCAELWSGRVLPEAREVVRAAGLPALLDRRRQVTVAEYEAIERARDQAIDAGDHATDRTLLGDWYERYYKTAPHLVFDGTADYYRRYSWSAE
jgi:hydroxymethylglutaryl-CoA synthase